MRTIGVVTVGRSDYGIYRPVLRRIKAEPDLRLHLVVAAAHLVEEFGMTIREIEADAFGIGDRVEMAATDDTPKAVARSISTGSRGFADVFSKRAIDILLVLGDRFEMHTAVVAAAPFTIPVAHIHGGETSEGATDELYRHSITKMSHLHFVSTDLYRQRVIRMGEEPWRVTVSGAPSLDNLRAIELMDTREIEKAIGLALQPPPLLVTFHPVTLEPRDTARQIHELLGALESTDAPVVFTYPNADAGHELIVKAIRAFVRGHPRSRLVANLGTRLYFSLMSRAAAMVGNSSSGIIEAASFRLPVVNVGARQRGRLHEKNVVDVDCTGDAILRAIRQVTRPSFHSGITRVVNPYGDGQAAERIVKVLKKTPLDRALVQKKFHDA